MKGDFIKLARSIQDNFLWKEKPFSAGQAWIDLLMLAEWKDTEVVSKGRVTILHRGQVGRSVIWLSDRWGWSRGKTIRFLRTLNRTGMVTLNGTTSGTTITIENYNKYQCACTTDDTTDGTAGGTTGGTHSKNNKEIKNKESTTYVVDKKDDQRQIPPALDMVRDYCLKRNNGIDAEKFYDYYEANGWYVGSHKMKDWKAAVRTWEKKENHSGAVIRTVKDLKDLGSGISQEDYERMEALG